MLAASRQFSSNHLARGCDTDWVLVQAGKSFEIKEFVKKFVKLYPYYEVWQNRHYI